MTREHFDFAYPVYDETLLYLAGPDHEPQPEPECPDDAIRPEDVAPVQPDPMRRDYDGQLIPEVVVQVYGLHLERAVRDPWRGERFKAYLHNQLADDMIPPPWDYVHARSLFRQRREEVLTAYMKSGVLPNEPAPGTLTRVERQRWRRAAKEYWFLRPRPRRTLSAKRQAEVEATLRAAWDADEARRLNPPPRRPREASDEITKDQFGNAYNAVAFANDQGYTLNTHLAVTWSTVGVVDDAAVVKAHQDVLELLRKFLTKTLRVPALWVFALERGKARGLHSHIMLHLPREQRGRAMEVKLRTAMTRAVATVTGEVPVETEETKTVFVETKGGRKGQWAGFLYLMKGVVGGEAEPKRWQRYYAEVYGWVFHEQPVPQGRIEGLRVGTSRALGEAARRAAGFESQWDRGHRTADRLYISNYEHLREMESLLPVRESLLGPMILDVPGKPVFVEKRRTVLPLPWPVDSYRMIST